MAICALLAEEAKEVFDDVTLYETNLWIICSQPFCYRTHQNAEHRYTWMLFEDKEDEYLPTNMAVADHMDMLNEEQQAFIRWSNLLGTYIERYNRGEIGGMDDFIIFLKDGARSAIKSASKLG